MASTVEREEVDRTCFQSNTTFIYTQLVQSFQRSFRFEAL